jgi:PadR family transcriptional regulator AphA
MSLDYAILGFLNYQPFTGYDLKKVFDESIRHFWAADQAQIYRTLARLVERGQAEMEVIHQEDRPDRKVYHITDRGRLDFLHWLEEPKSVNKTRSADLIQVFFSGELSDEVVINIFERHAAKLREIQNIYEDIARASDMPSSPNYDKRDRFFWMLTLEFGIASVRAQLSWMESVIERLKKGDYTLRISVEDKEKGEIHESE